MFVTVLDINIVRAGMKLTRSMNKADEDFFAALKASEKTNAAESAKRTALADDLKEKIATSEKEAVAQVHITNAVQHAGGMTRDFFDRVNAKSVEGVKVERDPMALDGMCGIRALVKSEGLDIEMDGQFKDLLSRLRKLLLELTVEQKKYVHLVNELRDPASAVSARLSDFDVHFSEEAFDKHVGGIGALTKGKDKDGKDKYDTHLESGFLLFLARMHGVLYMQVYLKGDDNTFRIHSYGGSELYYNLTPAENNGKFFSVTWIAEGGGHFDLLTLPTQSAACTPTPSPPSQSTTASSPSPDSNTPTVLQDVDSTPPVAPTAPAPQVTVLLLYYY